MRTLTNSTYISLDGVVQDPDQWPSLEGDDPRGYEIQTELLRSCDVLILGRRTYEAFVPVWAGRSGDPFTDHINAMRKYVFSTTLEAPEWANTTVVADDPVGAVRRLKEEGGGGIVQYGFGDVSFALLEAGLLDELRLWVHPFIVGRGGPEALLYRDTATTTFAVHDVTRLNNGLVVLAYRR